MQRIIVLLLFMITDIPVSRSQVQVEIQPLIGYPLMLSGRNNGHYGSVTGRLQLSYANEGAPWYPYFAASLSAMELPLHSKQINTLSMPVLNTAFKVGLNGTIKNNEFKRSLWIIGGGIGVCMMRPDEATLRMDNQETFLGYTTLLDDALFPQVELGLRWTRYPKTDLGWYFGVKMLTEALWLKDTKVRYTTVLSGTQYNLSFNDIVVWPSIGGIIGWRF